MGEEKEYYEHIVEALKNDDRIVFEQLFKDLYGRLCAYAEAILRDGDAAEDIVQNVFCLLWERRKEIVVTDSLKSYLYRSVYNASINSLKHERVKLAFRNFIEAHGRREENNIEYYFDRENREQLVQELNRAIELLPEQCRDIFLLSRFSGKKSSEIAVMLGISVRTVETQLYRAMKRLKDELSHLKSYGILWHFFIPFKG